MFFSETSNSPQLMTTKEAAKYLKMAPKTLADTRIMGPCATDRRRTRIPRVPYVKAGRFVWYRKKDLDQWVKNLPKYGTPKGPLAPQVWLGRLYKLCKTICTEIISRKPDGRNRRGELCSPIPKNAPVALQKKRATKGRPYGPVSQRGASTPSAYKERDSR